jgi:S-(hydroxymethyl)glutathione dehydrogenase/alcohol dehydrogenase
MRAAVLRSENDQLSIEELTIDRPGSDEVLIQTMATGLCHSDLHFIDGTYPAPRPFLPGHEAAGVVQAVGSDVVGIFPGDHVVTCLSAFCGSCPQCLRGHSYLCERRFEIANRGDDEQPRIVDGDGAAVNAMAGLGGFATEMLVHQNTVVSIDPDLPLDRAALIGCSVTTGVGAVFRSAGVEPGSTVAVIGCGGVGISVIQGAHLAGAREVIAIDIEPQTRMGKPARRNSHSRSRRRRRCRTCSRAHSRRRRLFVRVHRPSCHR